LLSRFLSRRVWDCRRCWGGENGQARGLDTSIGAAVPTPGPRWMAGPAQQTSIEGIEAGEIRTSDEALACGTPGDGSWSECLVAASGWTVGDGEGRR
jgi:hypothetical protein